MDRDPEQARTALSSIKQTSKTALDEVRSVLGVIRDGDAPLAPQAELAELPRLLRGVESPGLLGRARRPARLGARAGPRSSRPTASCRRHSRTSFGTPARPAPSSNSTTSAMSSWSRSTTTAPDSTARLTGDGVRDGGRASADVVTGDDSRPARRRPRRHRHPRNARACHPARRRGRPRIVAARRRQGHRAPAVAGRGMIRVALADDQAARARRIPRTARGRARHRGRRRGLNRRGAPRDRASRTRRRRAHGHPHAGHRRALGDRADRRRPGAGRRARRHRHDVRARRVRRARRAGGCERVPREGHRARRPATRGAGGRERRGAALPGGHEAAARTHGGRPARRTRRAAPRGAHRPRARGAATRRAGPHE